MKRNSGAFNEVSRKFANLLGIMLCVSIVGCATMSDVPGWPRSTQSDKNQVSLTAGDKLLVSTRSGNQISIVVTAIEDNALVGYTEDKSRSRRINFGEITKIQREAHPVSRALGFVVAPLWLVVAIALPMLFGAAFLAAVM